MFSNLIKASFILLFLTLFSLPVLAQYEPKDSLYFMKDDGVFSEEEKDEEAEYIKGQCETSLLKKKYYDCSCIAGAYRLKRNEEKLTPQNLILNKLYTDEESKCVNPVSIAGDTYKFCKRYADHFHPRKENNQEYCECVSNKVAKDFTKRPYLKLSYIKGLRLKAFSSCGKEFHR